MDSLVFAFEKLEQKKSKTFSDTLLLRQKALGLFKSHGLPSRKQESWKYTSLKSFSEKVFEPVLSNQEKISLDQISAPALNEIKKQMGQNFLHLVFFNGQFVENLSSDLKKLSDLGLSIEREKENPFLLGPEQSNSEKINTAVQKVANANSDSMLELQKSFQGRILEVKLKPNASLVQTLQVINYIDHSHGPALMTQPAFRISLGENSKMSLLATWSGVEASTYFVQPLTEIELARNAHFNFVEQQSLGRRAYFVSHQFIKLNDSAQMKSLNYTAGSLLSRSQLNVDICGHGSSSQFLGLNVLGQNQHTDHKTKIHFIDGQSTSEQLYKSILAGEARSVFSGLIKINPKAQQSYSSQLNKNLLLSDRAQCDSEPQLEIEADDVKANHGSTVGQISDEELFYLRSRGLSFQKSMEMLSFGFAVDVVDRFEDGDLKNYLSSVLKSDFKNIHNDLAKAKSL